VIISASVGRGALQYFTGIKIQSRIHDSIEDAVTAIRLYYKYDEICRQGPDHLKDELRRMYETGRQCGWQVPDDSGDE